MTEDPRATLTELSQQIRSHFGQRLIGLYLFGSLASGDFHPGRSDLDLVAVLNTDITEGDDLDALRRLHEGFENAHSDWRDRIEVLYLSREVLASFESVPDGLVARVSPGEPMHLRELGGWLAWRLDWFGVLSAGETIVGPPPLEVGPALSAQQFREGVVSQLRELRDDVRDRTVAYVPARQGYILATAARAMYSLETGEQTSKERAIQWAAHRYPESAELLWSAYEAYRSDVHAHHARVVDFVDQAAAERGQERR